MSVNEEVNTTEEVTEEMVSSEKETLTVTETEIKAEDIGMSEEQALVSRFEQLLDVIDSVSHTMSARSLNRVLRSVVRHPLKQPVKFVNKVEKMVFDAAIQATDAKFMFIQKALNKFEQNQTSINEMRQESEKVENETESAS
jgi:hypothetical protein